MSLSIVTAAPVSRGRLIPEARLDWPESGERRLVAECMFRAITDYLGYSEDPDNAFQAEWWLHYRGDSPWTFVWCCEQLGIDPNLARTKILTTLERRKIYESKTNPGRLNLDAACITFRHWHLDHYRPSGVRRLKRPFTYEDGDGPRARRDQFAVKTKPKRPRQPESELSSVDKWVISGELGMLPLGKRK